MNDKRGEIATDEKEDSGRRADLPTMNKYLQLHSILPMTAIRVGGKRNKICLRVIQSL